MLNWEDERYVRLYTRDTVDWLSLSFEAQGLLGLLLRKVDRAGRIEIGKRGKRGVATILGHPQRWETIANALDELLTDGVIVIRGESLVFRNFVLAQEANQSDAARQRARRERLRDQALAAEVLGAEVFSELGEVKPRSSPATEPVTTRDELSQNQPKQANGVTARDNASRDQAPTSHAVTPNQPCRAEPAGGAVTQKPAGELPPLRDRMDAIWLNQHGKAFAWSFKEEQALSPALARADGSEEVLLERWARAVAWAGFPTCGGVKDLVTHWNVYGTDPPEKRATGSRKAPVAAEDIPAASFANDGTVADF